jgi:Flp pilus assembly protein TadD
MAIGMTSDPLVDPKHNLAAFNLAMCYDMLGQIEEAWRWYKRSWDLDPSDPDPVYNLAELSLRKRELAQAEKYCWQALDLFQKRLETIRWMPPQTLEEPLSEDELIAQTVHHKAVAHHLMAVIQMNAGKLKAALESAREAAKLLPTNARVLLLMADLHRCLGNQAEAHQALIRAMEIDPDIARQAFGHGSRSK